jgi:GNAT superfamily N-acetyltransferase
VTLSEIQFQYTTKDWGERRPIHRIQALQGNTEVGSLHWDSRRIRDLTVLPEHQRHGIATQMWSEGHRLAAENKKIPAPQHSSDRTDTGDAWARRVGGRLPKRKI